MLETMARDLAAGYVDWPGHLVAGEWCLPKAREVRVSENPNDGTELLRFYPSRELSERAVDCAETAFLNLEWSWEQRVAALAELRRYYSKYQDLLVRCLQVEVGKPQWEAKQEVEAICEYLDWVHRHFGEIRECLLAPARLGGANLSDYSLNPVGVTAAYLPFSSPFSSFVFYFTSSLVAGCPLIVFSSTQAAVAALVIARIVDELNLPAGVLSVVFGGFEDFRALLSYEQVRAVVYTGSKDHCDSLRAENQSFRSRQLILQSGGKNAALVHSSADLDKAVRACIFGAFRSAGQLCSSTSRVFVFRSLLPEFIERLSHAVEGMEIGRCDNANPTMGPLYSFKSVERFQRFQTMAYRESLETIYWGKALDEQIPGGFFVSPGIHLMKEFDAKSIYQSNILFMPDLAVYSYDVLNEAIDDINGTDSCLAVSFFGDLHILQDRASLFHAPNLIHNAPTTELEASLPLAGRSWSGHHRYHGPALALYLCYPQALRHEEADWDVVKSWPLGEVS